MTLPSCCTHSSCFLDADLDNVSMKGRTEDRERKRIEHGKVLLCSETSFSLYTFAICFLVSSSLPLEVNITSIQGAQGKHKGSTSTSFPCGSAGKEFTCNVGDLGSIPGLGRFPGEGKGYPLQYSGLENSMGCIVHGVPKSRTWLSNFHSLPHSQGVNKVRVYASGGGGALALMLSKQVAFGFLVTGPSASKPAFQ